MKQISEDVKSLLTKEMENSAKKITEKVIEKINTKFDELSTRNGNNTQEGRGSRNPRQNQNSIGNLYKLVYSSLRKISRTNQENK